MVISMKSQRNFTLINEEVNIIYRIQEKGGKGFKPDLRSFSIKYTY